MKISLFDSHAHLQFAAYDQDRADVIERCQQEHIGVITVGTDLETSRKAVELADQHEGIWATVGFHPSHVVPSGFDDPDEGTKAATREPFNAKKFEELVAHPKVVGIGECGLDFSRIKNQELGIKEKQKGVFREQIELARRLRKPLEIHCRPSQGTQDAYEDILGIFKHSNFQFSNRAVVHFFVGTKEIAQQFLDLGFFIAFAGPITFAQEYAEVVRYVPLDCLLVETDAPYAAPLPHRGKRNEPVYVVEVAKKIAEIKGVAFEEVAHKTIENSKALFRL